jgi:hypothetical protein
VTDVKWDTPCYRADARFVHQRAANVLSDFRTQSNWTSRRRTFVNPTLKDLYSLGWPRAVARHRAILYAFQDVGSVSANVVEGPEIKRSFHRPPVMLPEERLDVRRKADAVVVRRRIHPIEFSRVGSAEPIHLTEPRSGVLTGTPTCSIGGRFTNAQKRPEDPFARCRPSLTTRCIGAVRTPGAQMSAPSRMFGSTLNEIESVQHRCGNLGP